MKSYGMTDETIKKIFQGQEIIVCANPQCNSPNMSKKPVAYGIYKYECDNCGESYSE